MENQDKRMEQIMQDMTDNALGLDDTFQFSCRECGKCCKNREDILLTARDIYNIAKHLGRTVAYVIDRYCETYIGQNSRIPIVRLKPSGSEKICPLLRDKKCIVHKVKPLVCALYPLGRAFARKPDEGIADASQIVPQYFIQSSYCGTRDVVHIVREWLDYFGIPTEDEFYALWTEATMIFADLAKKLESIIATEKTMDMLWSAMYTCLYANYDTEKELIAQFSDNADSLMSVLKAMGEATLEQLGDLDNAG